MTKQENKVRNAVFDSITDFMIFYTEKHDLQFALEAMQDIVQFIGHLNKTIIMEESVQNDPTESV